MVRSWNQSWDAKSLPVTVAASGLQGRKSGASVERLNMEVLQYLRQLQLEETRERSLYRGNLPHHCDLHDEFRRMVKPGD